MRTSPRITTILLLHGLLLFSTAVHAQVVFDPTRYPLEVVEAVRAPYKDPNPHTKSHLTKLSSLAKKYADQPSVACILHETMKHIYYWEADMLNAYRQSDVVLGFCEDGMRTQKLVAKADYSAMARAQHPDKVSTREVMDCYQAAYEAVKEDKPFKWADFYVTYSHRLTMEETTPENIKLASALTFEALPHKTQVESDPAVLRPLSINAFCRAINADDDSSAFAVLSETKFAAWRTDFWSYVSSNLICENEQRIQSAFALSPTSASGFMWSADLLGVYANKARPEEVLEVGNTLLSKIQGSSLAEEEKKPSLHQSLRILAGMHYRLKQKAQGDELLDRIQD